MSEVSNPSGMQGNETSGQEPDKKDVVAYESYHKLLTEKKNQQERLTSEAQALREELESLRMAQKQADEAKLNEQGQYKQINEIREQEIAQLRDQLQNLEKDRDSYKNDLNDTWKLQAFYDKLPGTVKRNEYLNFVDLDGIIFDPDTKQVDPTSVDNVVSKFMENHASLVTVSRKAGLPADAPKPAVKKSLNEMSKQERDAHMRDLIAASMLKP